MNGEVIEGLDIIEVLKFNEKKVKKYQAMFLQDLETIVPKNSEEFSKIRKLYLDWSNEYSRSLIRLIFGDDFEGQIK